MTFHYALPVVSGGYDEGGGEKWSYVLSKHVAGIRLGSGVAASSGSERESASIFSKIKGVKFKAGFVG